MTASSTSTPFEPDSRFVWSGDGDDAVLGATAEALHVAYGDPGTGSVVGDGSSEDSAEVAGAAQLQAPSLRTMRAAR
jgi:hypothetical protein